MSPVLILYAVLLAIAVLGLWAAYRVLGTPSRLTPGGLQGRQSNGFAVMKMTGTSPSSTWICLTASGPVPSSR